MVPVVRIYRDIARELAVDEHQQKKSSTGKVLL
jgi:hypothetical protein